MLECLCMHALDSRDHSASAILYVCMYDAWQVLFATSRLKNKASGEGHKNRRDTVLWFDRQSSTRVGDRIDLAC